MTPRVPSSGGSFTSGEKPAPQKDIPEKPKEEDDAATRRRKKKM